MEYSHFLYNKENKNEILPKNNNNSNIFKLGNPFFRNEKMLGKNYQYSTNFYGMYSFKESCYEIYKLNIINDSFYLAYRNQSNNITIIKYNIIDKTIIETINLNFETYIKKVKYFYDVNKNKEYLLIISSIELYIYLIKNENNYEKICDYKEKGRMSRGAEGSYIGNLLMNNIEIIYHKYNQKIYLIISFFYPCDCSGNERKISIINFDKNKLFKTNEYISSDFSSNSKKLYLIWENKISKIYYLITNICDKLIFLEINDNKESKNIHLENIFNKTFGEYGCIINSKNNKKDFLYISDNNGIITIIDLNEKIVINQFKIVNNIYSILNWNNKYIIFGGEKYIYIFDTNINIIINKKKANSEGEILSIKKIFFEKYKLYILCLDSYKEKEIKILY